MKSGGSDSMINGQVGLMATHVPWANFRTQTLLADVSISGEPAYQLEFCRTISGRMLSFRLLNTRGQEIDIWKFETKWGRKKLNLNGVRGNRSEKLEYRIGMFGGRHFITKDGKKPIYMTLTDHSRAFELEGMLFKHIDFQSQIHFRCQKRKLNQAILIANLIFNPPMTAEAAGS